MSKETLVEARDHTHESFVVAGARTRSLSRMSENSAVNHRLMSEGAGHSANDFCMIA